mgnify:FL=1
MPTFNELLTTGAYSTYLDAVNADVSIQRGMAACAKFGEYFPLPTTIDRKVAESLAADFTMRALSSAARIKGSAN